MIPDATPALTLDALLPILKAAGFRSVKTGAGYIPLDEWNPYGASPGGVNYRADYYAKRPWRGVFDGVSVTDDGDGQASEFYLGRWELTTVECPRK